jgi:DNA-binding MarR family transcriptional regulator
MPTPAGRKLAEAAQYSVAQHERALFACLTAAEQAELQRLLQKFRLAAKS